MRSPHRSSLLAAVVTCAAATAIVAGAGAAAASPRVGTFSAGLAAVNGSASGSAELVQRGTDLTVHLSATGLAAGPHLAHIHGVKHGQSACPTPAADADGNGVIDFAEGLPSYGPVVRTLSDGLNDTASSLDYTREFTRLDSGHALASAGPLDGYAVVVHGVDLDGDGLVSNPDVDGNGQPDPVGNEISTPALCAIIQP